MSNYNNNKNFETKNLSTNKNKIKLDNVTIDGKPVFLQFATGNLFDIVEIVETYENIDNMSITDMKKLSKMLFGESYELIKMLNDDDFVFVLDKALEKINKLKKSIEIRANNGIRYVKK